MLIKWKVSRFLFSEFIKDYFQEYEWLETEFSNFKKLKNIPKVNKAKNISWVLGANVYCDKIFLTNSVDKLNRKNANACIVANAFGGEYLRTKAKQNGKIKKLFNISKPEKTLGIDGEIVPISLKNKLFKT